MWSYNHVPGMPCGTSTPEGRTTLPLVLLCLHLPALVYLTTTLQSLMKWSVLPQKLQAPLLSDLPFTPRAAAPVFLGLASTCWLMASLVANFAAKAGHCCCDHGLYFDHWRVLVVVATGGFGTCGGSGSSTCTTPIDVDLINTYLTTL